VCDLLREVYLEGCMKKFCVIVCALLLSASTAGADVVADWNVIAGQSIDSGARRGPSGILDFAIVHAAMHDAARAYQGRLSRIAPRRGCEARRPAAIVR